MAKKYERTSEEARRTEEQTKEVAKVVMDEVWVSEWIHEETEDGPGGCVCVVDNEHVVGGLRVHWVRRWQAGARGKEVSSAWPSKNAGMKFGVFQRSVHHGGKHGKNRWHRC